MEMVCPGQHREAYPLVKGMRTVRPGLLPISRPCDRQSDTVAVDRHFKRKHRHDRLVTCESYLCGCRYGKYATHNPFSILDQGTDDHDAYTIMEPVHSCRPPPAVGPAHVLSDFVSRVRNQKEYRQYLYSEVQANITHPPCPLMNLPEATECGRGGALRRKARKIVKLLEVEQDLKAVLQLPSDFVCGTLRAKVRSIYPPKLTLVQELSIKTSAKAESQPCTYCAKSAEGLIEAWKQKRMEPVTHDEGELQEFGRAFSANVPDGWDQRKSPYVPNGHATLDSSRREGGNWVEGSLDAESRVELVHSSGKPRIVTLFSEFNVRTLTPLHTSLYASIKGREWLLQGSPTSEKMDYINSNAEGKLWHSFDYKSATDNIKTAYVRCAVDILKSKASLSEDEEACMDILGNLSFAGISASSGQPMGSPMSFPLLCLINKTIVDLALTDLMNEGKIGFKEWTRHPALINGDDLLTKSTSKGNLPAAIEKRGGQVGMETNAEKTITSPEYAEINSTVFKNCVIQKKTNVSSLWMTEDIEDVIGFANESCVSVKGFRMVAMSNTTRLSRQKIKIVGNLSIARKLALVSKRQLKAALRSKVVSPVQRVTELFPVITMPDGYDLSRQEEFDVLTTEVARARKSERWKPLFEEKQKLSACRKVAKVETVKERGFKYFAVMKAQKPSLERRTLRCFARAWETKRKEELLADDAHDPPGMIVSDLSGINAMIDAIRYMKKKTGSQAQKHPVLTMDDPFGNGCGFVSLTDGI